MPYLLLLIKYDFSQHNLDLYSKGIILRTLLDKDCERGVGGAFSPFAKHSLISIFIYRLHSTHYTSPHNTQHTP